MATENETNVEAVEKVEPARDTAMDLASLMKRTKTEEVSPLEKAMESKKENPGGMIVKTSDLKDEDNEIRANNDTDEFREAVRETSEEIIGNSKKGEAIVVIRKPENQAEDAQMMDEIDASYFDDNGKIVVPEGAKFIMPKYLVPEDQKDKVTKLVGGTPVEPTEANTTTNNNTTSNATNASNEEIDPAKLEKDGLVKILIDKTGLGADVVMSDEEQKIITESNEIHIVEVEDKELATLKVKRIDNEADLSFMETINKYQLSVSKTHMIFPISGFAADMTGLSYGEFADISLDVASEESTEEYDYNKNWKMFTVIFDKMQNITSGKFKNFEDFLKKFAYVDVPLAIYALLISTQPEEDTISLRCHADNCGKGFVHKYATRSLIDFDDANTSYLKAIDKVATARGAACFTVADESPIRTIKKIILPDTEFIAEIGPASCYDFLYGICNQMAGLQDNKDEDDVIKKLYYILILNMVRAINVKDNDGSYRRITNYVTMTEIFDKYLTPGDFNILQSIYVKSIEEYRIGFTIKNIVCPHCKSVTEEIDVDPRELVFRIQQTMRNTRLTLDNFQLF